MKVTNTKQERAERAILLRRMSGLTRAEIDQKHGIPQGSLRGWETPQPSRNGLTEKAAYKLVSAFQAEGITCTPEWLLHGTGPAPTFKAESNKEISEEWSDEFALLKEVELFETLNKNSITILVSDDTALPEFGRGDYIGGIFIPEGTEDKLFGKNCIIETMDGRILIRKLMPGNTGNSFSLVCSNPKSNNEIINHDVQIKRIAQIIWIRYRVII